MKVRLEHSSSHHIEVSPLVINLRLANNVAKMALSLLIFFALLGHPSCAHGFRDSWPFYWPFSIAESKKHGDFLYDVHVAPTRFMWEGHQIEVYECWREDAETNHWLYFKLKVDDRPSGERTVLRKEKKRICFTDESEKKSVIDFYGAVRRTVVHSVLLPNNGTSHLELRVGTEAEGKDPVRSMGDVVVSFDLNPPITRKCSPAIRPQ